MGRHVSQTSPFTTYATFGELLKVLRRRAQLTQRDLGVAVGYSESHITRMEANERRPDPNAVRIHFVNALGLENEPDLVRELIQLAEVAQEKAQTEGATPAKKPFTPGQTNLPVQLTRFIGRERERAEVSRLLGTTRLLTLTGSGGAGKTRLAIEIGAMWVTANVTPTIALTFPDGVWMVEFAALSEGRLVTDMIATTFGLQAMSRTSEEVLIEHLNDKELLLVLDNCEHLIADCAALVVKLLQTCPLLRLLVTSREGLNVPGEVIWRVPSLAHDEAMALFLDRARAVQSDLVIDASNAVFIERICERLVAMPLALELAAVRLRSFSVEQIATRLDDAFRILTSGSRTVLPRQQTLRATIDWSYALLSEDERTLLRELAIFSGGWALEAAEAVHGPDALDLLDQLVSKSLVQMVPTSSGFRYTMLEMIRQYAVEKLSKAGSEAITQVRAKHLTYYYQLAQRSQTSVWGYIEEKDRRTRMVHEIPNFRAAVEWAIESSSWRIGLDLTLYLADNYNATVGISYGVLSGYVERMMLGNTTMDDNTRGRVFLANAQVLGTKGDMVGGISWCKRAIELAQQTEDANLAYDAQLFMLNTSPNYDETIASLERIRDDAHKTGDIRHELDEYFTMGYRMTLEGHYQEAMEALAHADHLSQRNMDYSRSDIQWRLGQVYLAQRDYAHARSALELSIALARENDHNNFTTMVDLGTVGVYTGDLDIARSALAECLDFQYRYDNMERLAQGLVLGAGLAHVLGQLGTAAQLLSVAAAIRKVYHTHGVSERELFLEYDRRLPAMRATMEPEAFERAWEVGQGFSLKHAMALAMAL